MYNKHKISLTIIFIISLLISFFFKLGLNENAIQNLITFFSIIFGFYLTAIATLYGTEYSKKLYNEIDPKKKSQTQLHTLRYYFRYSCSWALLSIITLIIYSLFKSNLVNNIELQNIGFKITFFKYFIIPICTINIGFIILLLKVFFIGFIEEASMDTVK